ncbi:hypothetical protein MHYP_G00053070 [Metynnis hypsauchen]
MKLWLVLLLGTCTFALARRYKNFRRYVYQYEAETQNSVNTPSSLRSGPKITCKVEIDVPRACSFVLNISGCSLSEVVDMDTEGFPVYGPAAETQAFQAAMEKNTLKVMVEGENSVKLFPEEDETINILNIKRGIVSALLVPDMEMEKNKNMATVHGTCVTDFRLNNREDIATDVTITRDLSGCDGFSAQRDYGSPVALISGMHSPLSRLISSTQICNYRFDNQKKHMTLATCTEKHVYLPFSYRNEYGISSIVKQVLTLHGTNKINDRVFHYNEANLKNLPMEATEEKAPVQSTDALLTVFKELRAMHQNQQGHQRASTFYKLVSELRRLESDVLKQAVTQMVEEDQFLTWQGLIQCGTPECSSTMLKILRGFSSEIIEIDAAIYALAMVYRPSDLLVRDILEMARNKQSKPIMFALSNVVRKHFQQTNSKVTPAITAVHNYVSSILGTDCAGDKELTYLILRVVGNMGKAMEAANPNIKNILLKCMRQPVTTLSVQIAAIQAFRYMSVTDEVRLNIQRVAQYSKGAVQKRLAAYLLLMRNPVVSDLELVKKILKQEQNMQVRSFVSSHIYNIVQSKDKETQKLAEKIIEVMQDREVINPSGYTKLSRNYKMEAYMTKLTGIGTNMQGNIIFDPSSQLPKEVMLETTLKVFGHSFDVWEFGMEGKGFDPSIEAIFGKNGFFPDTISKAVYWVGDKMPNPLNEVLQQWMEPLRTNKTKRQVSEDILKEIAHNFKKLVKDLRDQESPEAMAYLRIMGAELGYIKGNGDLSAFANRMVTYYNSIKLAPSKIMMELMSGKQNIFAHYIFMDNQFHLPTASGLPLRFTLSGTFTPGLKGGLHMEQSTHELTFSPSMGVEFVTRMGVHVPKFVASAVEMHTNFYHESSLNAKISMAHGQIKLTIPALKGTTQLLSASNLLLVLSSQKITQLPGVGVKTGLMKCSPLFTGVKYCTTVRYTTARSNEAAPYFPLNGETKIAVDICPTDAVTGYTATFSYELLNEGNDGRQKSDSLRMILRSDGPNPIEATAAVKYNRNKNVLTTSINIPDYDVEGGIRVGITNSSVKGKKLTIDISNKNIPQVSLVGHARLEEKKDGLLQAQVIVPSLKSEAALTATIRRKEDLTLELKSNITVLEISSIQNIVFKYADDEVKVQLKSDMDSKIQNFMLNTQHLQSTLQWHFQEIMHQRIAQTDMNLHHIYSKTIEASRIWMDKMSADVPFIQTVKNNMPELVMPALPEKLYLNAESTLKYQFNKDHITTTISLPLGGTTSEDLRIPHAMATPGLSMPQIGLTVPSKQFRLPTFSIPSSYDFTLPLLGMAQVSAKICTNFYNFEAMISGGNNTVEGPSYIANYKFIANSSMEILSYRVEGTAHIADVTDDALKITFNSSLSHKLIDTHFSLTDSVTVMRDAVKGTGNYKMQVFSPLGMDMSMVYTSQTTLSSDITGEGNMEGHLTVGPVSASTSLTQFFVLQPSIREARAESSFRVSSSIVQIHNKIKAAVTNEELSFESNTNINNDPLKHTTKFNIDFKKAHFTFKSDSVTKADKRMIRNQVDFSATIEEASIRVESQVDHSTNHAYSLIAGSLNTRQLELNGDVTVNFNTIHGSHKGTLSLTKDGLTTSCTTIAQVSPVTLENVFHGDIGSSGASLSLTTQATMQEHSAELKVEGRLTSAELYLNSMYIGDVFNSSAKNTVTFRLTDEDLNFSNNLIASLQDIRLENAHSLTLSASALAIHSEADNFLNNNNFYKHKIVVDVSSFTASVQVNSDLKILGANFINDAQVKAEPHQIDLTGTLKGALAEEELRHTYEISNILAVAEPFLFSDGELDVYGKHSGQMKGKLLVSVQPLSFSLEHECKASTSHQLGNGNSIETNFQNEITGAFALERQSFNVKMQSKLNEHAFDQVLELYNTLENLGFELRGMVLTNLLNKVNKDQEEFSVSVALQYEKNSDSHFISLPFTENLPKLREQIKTSLYSLKDHWIELLQDSNGKYNVGANIRSRASELKQIFESFDVNVFFADVENAIHSIEVKKYVNKLSTVVSSEEITKSFIFVREIIETVVKKNYISSRINEIYAKVEEIVAEYEIEPLVEKSVDNAVELMKKYNLKETMQLAISHLKSVNIKPLFDQCSRHVNELVRQLDSLDFRHMTDELSDYVDRVLQKLTYFDTFAVETREKVLEMTRVLCFGKLYSEFEINSPDHKMKTTARLENSTNSETSQFIAILNSQFDTPIGLLAYSFNSAAQLVVPKIRHISLLATVSVHHTAFSLDHQGSLAVRDTSSQASSKTTVKVTTYLYTAELVNSVAFALKSGFSGTMDMSYEHNLTMPLVNIFSEAAMTQKSTIQMTADIITLALKNEGRGKCSLFDYLHEGIHKSDMEFVMDIQSTKLMFSGDTDSNLLKMKQNLNIEFRHFRYFTITAHVQTDTPFIKRSVAVMKGQIQIQDPKIELIVSHNAELVGKLDGIMSNSLNAKAVPFKIAFDTKNKNNIKLILPFKLYGIVDLQNDLTFNLNATAQQASWTGLARFNQYKYSHYINMVNVEKEIQVTASVNGEANLDILTMPIEIPEMMVPFISLKTTPIHSISLWEDTGLRKILISPHQLFDMDIKWKYVKSPKVVALDINMEQLFNAVNTRVLCKNLLTAAEILSTIFNHSRALSQVTLPKITLPKTLKTIRIPAMGDLIYEFSVKTTIITLNTKVSILNQDDIVTQFEAQSTSEFDVFNAKLTGATIFNRDRMKLTTKTSLVHINLECIHNGLLVLSTEAFESSTGNVAKDKLPNVNVDLYQEVTGTIEEGISISASMPSAGLIGLQLKSKSPSYIIGRVYSRYPSDFQNDVDILKVTITLVDSEKLNFQTQWNMEVPNEMLHELKEQVPAVIYSLDLTNHMDTISTELDKVYNRVESTIAHIKDEGKVMYRRATEHVVSSDLIHSSNKLSDKILSILRAHQRNIQVWLDAAISFLRDTQFQLPGYSEKLSGLELCNKIAVFITDVIEVAITRVPEALATYTESITDNFRTMEFTVPGTNQLISGGDILNDLHSALQKAQYQLSSTVKSLGNIHLDIYVQKLSGILNLSVDKVEELFTFLRSQEKMDKLSTWVSDVYTDAFNILHQILIKMKDFKIIIEEYYIFVKAKVQEILTDMLKKLNADTNHWTDTIVRCFDDVQNQLNEVFEIITKNVESYVKVNDTEIDISIPLPFTWEDFGGGFIN